ncbi:hypothetical protein L6452_28913 [Arctium lappa]|uniref:Uncharacterized protein n=1 Tax=Arctium lappa TaxID=4217 RepID=A0ACB8ZZ66_ARCLA|nr:hypothetical protein L6452_28913 [Arctium lappa]
MDQQHLLANCSRPPPPPPPPNTIIYTKQEEEEEEEEEGATHKQNLEIPPLNNKILNQTKDHQGLAQFHLIKKSQPKTDMF